MKPAEFMQRMGADPDGEPLFAVQVFATETPGDYMLVIVDTGRNETVVMATHDLRTIGSTLQFRMRYDRADQEAE